MASPIISALLLIPALCGAASIVAAGQTGIRVEFDPLATALADNRLTNREGTIPPQCYTKTGAYSNPCWACHTTRNGRNLKDDWEFQAKYEFSDTGRENHWTNLFKDRRTDIAAISDAKALVWIREDNYSALRTRLASRSGYIGWRPNLDFAKGFDADGFARDGSGWRAFRYKPFPGTFWPTNGSADDVFIRLPDRFRRDSRGRPSTLIYRINLAILEAVVGVPDTVAAADAQRRVEPLDEAVAGMDLDGDGRVGGIVTILAGIPRHYAGAAQAVPTVRFEYPVGTEFLHTVRYLDPDRPDLLSTRMKEVRYSIKYRRLTDPVLEQQHVEEEHERKIGALSTFGGNANSGLTTASGWVQQGFIEAASGDLRLQTRQEQMYCVGCHGSIGVTVDGTFALPRKVPGLAGWGHQDLAGIQDVPQAGSRTPEILSYLQRVGGGDEFRANDEVLARFFPHGRLDRRGVSKAAPGGTADIRDLVVPSRQRALALDKAYMVIVAEQSYARGREPVIAPARNVNAHLENTATALRASSRIYQDGRLWLDWGDVSVAARKRPIAALQTVPR